MSAFASRLAVSAATLGLAASLATPAGAELLDDVIGAVGVSGAPGGDKDAACAQTGIDKVADQLK